MAFGERLQELRRARGMTQEDFAAQLKVSRQAVSKWESAGDTRSLRRSSISATATASP